MRLRNRFLLASLASIVACESDVAKLQRLEQEKVVACLAARYSERQVDSALTAESPKRRARLRIESLSDTLEAVSYSVQQMRYDPNPTREKLNVLIAKARSTKRELDSLFAFVDSAKDESANGESDNTQALRAELSRRSAQCELATREYERFKR